MDKQKLNKELDAVTDFFYDDINGEFAGEMRWVGADRNPGW